jgi:8-oxo-dGTP pyrophosphatase MutT (NUDIX family)
MGAVRLDEAMSERRRHMFSGSVFVVALRGDLEVLMLRRARTGWMDGYWSLPAGGLDAGETLRSAAARELAEEVGLVVEQSVLRHAHVAHSLTEGRDWVGHFFTATTWKGEPSLREPDRHDQVQWFCLADLPEPTIPYVRQALSHILVGTPYSEFGWPA